MRRIAALALLAALLATAGAHAQSAPSQPSSGDVTVARDLFRQGAKAAQAGQWEEARVAYEKSYALRPSSLTRYSLAVAQKETGHLVDALEGFRAFLRDPMDAASSQYRPQAEQSIRSLEGKVAWVVVTAPSLPARAEIKLDGVPIQQASLGARRPVDPGRHKIEAWADRHRAFLKEFEVGPAGSTQITVQLEAESAAPIARPSTSASGATTPDPSVQSSRGPLGAGLAIGGGALLVGGVVVGLLGVSKASNAATRDGSDADSARTLALVGDVVGGVGIVAIAVGGYLLLTRPSSRAEQPKAAAQAAWSPWVSHTGAGLAFGGAF
jgi:hypothetical protein